MNTKPKRHQSLTLWIAVTLAFLLLIAAWSSLITIAQKHKPQLIEPTSKIIQTPHSTLSPKNRHSCPA